MTRGEAPEAFIRLMVDRVSKPHAPVPATEVR